MNGSCDDRLDRARVVADRGQLLAGLEKRLPVAFSDGGRVGGASLDQPTVRAVRDLEQRGGDRAGPSAGPQRFVQ
jgi:hypothetical protein